MVVTIEVSEEPPALVNGKVHEEAALQALESQLMPDGGGGDNDNNDDDDEEEDQPSAASKRKREPESDATDVDNDFEDDDAFDDVVNDVPATSQSLTATLSSSVTTPVSIKSRRPSRSCKPNSLIFNSDTTTLSPKRRRKVVRESLSPSPDLSHQQSNNTSGDSNSSTTANGRKSAATATISSRSFARESVRKAVSALTGLNRPVKKLGRPRKYPIEGPAESVSPVAVKNGRIPVGRKGRKVGRGKKLTVKKASSASPVGKCTPILTAILSGQSLAQTKTGRPKGRPRVLPSLDEVILNGAKSSPNTTSATRSSPRRCDCEAKYKKILSNLEQSLEVKFAESTHKLRKDMESTDAENTRLQNRIASLQRELDYLKNRLDHAKESTASQQEIGELKLKHQYELSHAKRTQWCANCEREAIYFCCWNSSYCSMECQQQHWHAVHKKVCRNKDVKR